MEAFIAMMRSAGLIDMVYNGQHFTWCNNREGSERIKERLDRAIVNADWICEFAKAEVTHKLNICSDHYPLLVHMERKRTRTKRPFRFEKVWMEKRECTYIIQGVWDGRYGPRNRGGIHDRLGKCRHKLRQWSKHTATNNKVMINKIQNQLKTIQQAPNNRYNRPMERHLKQQLKETWAKEEEYWRELSRIEWLKLGDRNTTYFHQATVERRRKNTIHWMQIRDGRWVENEQDIVRQCEDHFRNMFQAEGCEEVEAQLECIPKLIGEEVNRRLTRRVGMEEVKQAVFELGGNKALGPDGFPGVFYHR